jgi:hypothetical protein
VLERNSPKRRWLVGLVAIVIAAAAVAFYFLKRPSRLEPTAMAAYLPQRDAAMLYIDLAAIRSSGILTLLLGSVVAEEAEYKKFVQATGFDYKKDLDQIIMRSAESVHHMLLQGRFDWKKLEQYASSNGGVCRDGFCSLTGSTQGRVISFRRESEHRMALSSGFSDREALQIGQRPPIALPFLVPDKPIWMYLPAATMRSSANLPTGTRLFVKALEAANYSVATLGPSGQDFEALMDISCNSAEDAATLRAQLEAVTDMLRKFIAREKQAPSTSDFAGVLTSGGFTRVGTHVSARWPIHRSFLETITKN